MAAGRLRSRDVALGAAFLGLAASSLACGFGPEPPDEPYYQPNYGSGGYTEPGHVPPPAVDTPVDTVTDETYVFYCVDETELIVDPTNCDENLALDENWPYFLAFATFYGRNLRVGTRLPKGGDMFSAADTESRLGWGLPSRVTNGSTVRSGIVGGTHTGTVGS